MPIFVCVCVSVFKEFCVQFLSVRLAFLLKVHKIFVKAVFNLIAEYQKSLTKFFLTDVLWSLTICTDGL